MLAAPDDLEEAVLAAALLDGWGIRAGAMSYLAVGWGDHHWDVRGADGARWFVTVVELTRKRVSDSESLADGFWRLRDSLLTAVALRDAGLDFVTAPATGAGREPASRFGGRFAVAVYPFTEGQSFRWGEWSDELRSAVLALVVQVHQAPERVRRLARAEDFWVPFRELTEAVLDGWDPPERGPCTTAVARLLREYTRPVRRRLERYDALVAEARKRPERNVLTHGEPHPGNVMRTSAGWRLIDWDTALLAPPERDLWSLGDSAMAEYAAATGVAPRAEVIELYRLGWDVKDLAVDVARFFRPHGESADDVESWRLLSALIRQAGS
jgi:spectinomycin phosphotransferase/16S rRNA (guanine(1405)-N(7))-methyltransferase